MIYQLIKKYLFKKDAEKAHDLVFNFAEKYQHLPVFRTTTKLLFGGRHDSLAVTTSGITFPGPVGLAAGFDKNARLLPILQETGFGFLEIGSITAQVSEGNPKPRMFRLPDDLALINRMGLNNDGAEKIMERFQLYKPMMSIPVGINIAKTHDTTIQGDKAIEDYRFSLLQAAGKADYITVNISCPNSGDGKSFEDPIAFEKLISTLRSEKASKLQPLFVKFSSDIEPDTLKELLEISELNKIDGYVAVNTSNSRIGLKTDQITLSEIGKGGLSGKPIEHSAITILKLIRDMVPAHKTVISVGGILSPEDAYLRLTSGANLVQVYTGLVYNGPGFPKEINELLLKKDWQSSIN